MMSLQHMQVMIAVMAHDRQTLHVTGRPSHITYRPWQLTGRHMHNLGVCDMSNQKIDVILTCFDME